MSVLDGQSDSVISTVDVDARPYVLAVDEATNKIYVSNTFSDVLTIIDGASNKTTKMKIGSKDAMVVSPKMNRLYLLGYEDPNINALAGTSEAPTKVHIGTHLWGMELNEASQTLYVTRIGVASVTAVDERTGNVSTIPTGAMPCAVAVNPSKNIAYVANYGDDSVTIIDGAKRAAIATVPVGKHPQAIAVDARANLIYTANTHGNSASVIDGSTYKVIATLNAGTNPYAVAVDAESGKVFVANMDSPGFTMIEASSRKQRIVPPEAPESH